MRSLLVAAAAALFAGVLPAQPQYNVTFHHNVIIMPVTWNGQPAFMLGVQPAHANPFVTFYAPGFRGPHEVALHVELFGVIDGRACVDHPWEPMHINYGEYDYQYPWYRVHQGVNLYVPTDPSNKVLHYYNAGIEYLNVTVRSLYFDGRYRSICGEPELVFFIVTPELLS